MVVSTADYNPIVVRCGRFHTDALCVADARPARPEFLDQPAPQGTVGRMFTTRLESLIDAHRTGEGKHLDTLICLHINNLGRCSAEPLSSGHDYRQALELAIALKLSAAGTPQQPLGLGREKLSEAKALGRRGPPPRLVAARGPLAARIPAPVPTIRW